MKLEKKKKERITGAKEARLGTPLGIHDKNNNELRVGDRIRWGEYEGIILYNKDDKKYWFLISYSMWYGENEYDSESYGKGFELRMDDGPKMEMELIDKREFS